MTNPILRYKTVMIDGQEYKFQYTVKAVLMCEKALTQKSILKTLIDMPLSYADTFEFFRWGIYGGGKQMTADEVENLFLKYLESYNIGDMQQLIMEALMASGVVGNVTGKK